MVAVHVNLDDTVNSEDENLIVSRLNAFLRRYTDKETADRLDQLLGDLPSLAAVRQSNSLLMYFYCDSVSEMYKLYQLLESGQLKVVLEEVFGILSGTSSGLNVAVRLEDEELFTDCYNQLLKYGLLNYDQFRSFVWFIFFSIGADTVIATLFTFGC